ncbi:MAG: AMP-binding protein [Proteobacteria bacterium]|nr:AMP-binding protein [Pseudomonadota bacterium]
MTAFYDSLETRSDDERASDLAQVLPAQIVNAQKNATGFATLLAGIDASTIAQTSDLANLPVLRKTDLSAAQKANAPLGGFAALAPKDIRQVFQSPGPIYEMGQKGHDWWRFGRFLHALGVGADDVVQNTFSYHFTPAGMMFENAAEAVGATVFPAGPGQTELQARAAADLGVTCYTGTPDYLNTILQKGDALGLDLSKIRAAAVSGGPLFPQIRQGYIDRGITCLQCYATADLGHIAYETAAMDGLIVDEGVIVEIVVPGTGKPVATGEIGEVVVTTLNPDYPLIRFATGDLSAILPGVSPCGRTNMRIAGWKGRADQATKVKGMFVRPEQVAALLERHPEVHKARVEVNHDGQNDTLLVRLETENTETAGYAASIRELLKLRADVVLCHKGDLPCDGLVIADGRAPG